MDTRQLKKPPLFAIAVGAAALDGILSLNLNIKLNSFPKPLAIRLPASVHSTQEYDEPSGDGGAEDAQSQRSVHYRVLRNLCSDQNRDIREDVDGCEGDEFEVREEQEPGGSDDGDEDEDVDGSGVRAFADGEAGRTGSG